MLCEEMARVGSGGTAAGIGAHINIATPPIWKFGSEDQKRRNSFRLSAASRPPVAPCRRLQAS